MKFCFASLPLLVTGQELQGRGCEQKLKGVCPTWKTDVEADCLACVEAHLSDLAPECTEKLAKKKCALNPTPTPPTPPPSPAPAGSYTVMVVGDSWGSYGPGYGTIQSSFDSRNVPASVQSTAIGGTTACQWAKGEKGTPGSASGDALVVSAQTVFPELPDGPDFVWYTLGGNDAGADEVFQACIAKAASQAEAMECYEGALGRKNACTEKLLETYWAAYPKSKVFQCGYDLPCYDTDACLEKAASKSAFCGTNVTCYTSNAVLNQHAEIDARQAKYAQPQYTGLNIIGTTQKAAGVPGADVGQPVLTQGGPCDMLGGCVHPRPGSAAATAIGDAFWDLFFSKYVKSGPSPSEGGAVV